MDHTATPEAADGRSPFRVELVCLGNICRSPMADVVLRARLERLGLDDRVRVTSSGIGPWHVGEPMRPQARQALAARGYDGSEHRARQLDADEALDRDLILVMDAECAAHLRAELPGTVDLRMFRSYDVSVWSSTDDGDGTALDVPDPYYGGPADFEHALDLVERAVDGLAAELQVRFADTPR